MRERRTTKTDVFLFWSIYDVLSKKNREWNLLLWKLSIHASNMVFDELPHLSSWAVKVQPISECTYYYHFVRAENVIQGTSAQSAFFIKSTHNICLVTHLISILTASQWCRTPQFFNVLALRHFVTINIIHSNWLWQFFKWGKKKKRLRRTDPVQLPFSEM